MGRTSVLALLAFGLAWGAWDAPARANGMAYVHRSGTTGTGEVGQAVPTDQRAALVRDGTAWSLILEPRYERPDAGAAWLVPFAHCPTVSAADPALLAELGLATAPLFLDLCVKECRCGDDDDGGCLPPFGGSTAGDAGDEGASAVQGDGDPLAVDVWQSGTLGNLDFVVISAADPADIPAWLDREGYDSPPSLADFVVAHADAYGCYFAARIAAGGGGLDAFPSVRFDLDPRDPPTYPLQLTKLGVAQDRTLGLTLFVVNPSDRYDDGSSTVVIPANFDARASACTGRTAADFRTCLDAELSAAPDVMTVTFHDALGGRKAALLDRAICNAQHRYEDPWDPGWCLSTTGLLDGIPDTWTAQVEVWLEGHARVTRYEGRLPPAMLDRDLIFHVGPGTPATPCARDSDCLAVQTWEWDGGACAPDGTCRVTCYLGESDCPAGWNCLEHSDDSGYYQPYCAPPAATNPAIPAALQDPLPPIDGLHVAYRTDCGLKCSDICDGRVSSGVVVYGPPRTPRAFLAKVPMLAVVLAAQLVLLGLRRRRRARA